METPPVIFDNLDMICLAARTVAGEARQRIEFRLAAWGLERLAGDVHLVTAELITNACAAAPQGQIRVKFDRESGSVFLGVWDASEIMPCIRPVRELELDDLDLSPENFDENGGWGLQLVRALASEFGVSRTNPHGKWVWARFAL